MKKQKKFFYETAIIDDNERDEARSYLNYWKKYLLRRLGNECYNVKVLEEHWGEIPPHFMGSLAQRSKIYLKLVIEYEWKYTDEHDMNGTDIE